MTIALTRPGRADLRRGGTVLAAVCACTILVVGFVASINRPYWIYAVWLVVVGCGVTLALPSLTIAISGALPREQAGVAGGLQATTRELGSALGVAVVSTVLTSRLGSSRPAAVVGAYAGAADTALKIVAAVVLVAGALVIAELTWSGAR